MSPPPREPDDETETPPKRKHTVPEKQFRACEANARLSRRPGAHEKRLLDHRELTPAYDCVAPMPKAEPPVSNKSCVRAPRMSEGIAAWTLGCASGWCAPAEPVSAPAPAVASDAQVTVATEASTVDSAPAPPTTAEVAEPTTKRVPDSSTPGLRCAFPGSQTHCGAPQAPAGVPFSTSRRILELPRLGLSPKSRQSKPFVYCDYWGDGPKISRVEAIRLLRLRGGGPKISRVEAIRLLRLLGGGPKISKVEAIRLLRLLGGGPKISRVEAIRLLRLLGGGPKISRVEAIRLLRLRGGRPRYLDIRSHSFAAITGGDRLVCASAEDTAFGRRPFLAKCTSGYTPGY
jgi:hypothetical protein